MGTASEAIFVLHRTYLDRAADHGVQRERARNLAQVAALKSEVEQVKKELAEEKVCIASYLEEIDDLRVVANIQPERHHRPEEEPAAGRKKKEMRWLGSLPRPSRTIHLLKTYLWLRKRGLMT